MIPAITYLVGIGASAGGLEAIQKFFNHMPKTDELTFVIAQHLSPDFISMMSELLAHHTAMPIVTVSDNMQLRAGTIYLIPASFAASVANNRFTLTQLNRQAHAFPIDILLTSIAAAYQQHAIGVILSGTGSDGMVGMTAIAKQQGLTLVQKPTEAKFPDMPKHAIASAQMTGVLSVLDMPEVIFAYIHQSPEFANTIKKIESIGKSKYANIFALLETKYNINFNVYKMGTMSRRIQRRMQLSEISDIAAYLAYLQADPSGLQILYQDLLIGVTKFFRDKEAFAILKAQVIPALFSKRAKQQEEIRIWINPCATGEEAYSVAILLKEYAEEQHVPFAVKIFASDVCPAFIKQAKKGCYSHQAVASVPKALLDKYFIKSAEHYQIIPEIKQKILFITHNVLNDPPFTKMDLVCCRNLLIYINHQEQKHVTDMLRFSLNVGGFLFLGPSEGLVSLMPDLIVKNQHWKIFKKIKHSGHTKFLRQAYVDPLSKQLPNLAQQPGATASLPLYAYHAILQDVVSSGFIIDDTLTVRHCIGQARALLIYPEGAPTLILPKIIVDELKGPLIIALHKVKHKLMPVTYDNIVMHQANDQQHIVKMAVHPICDSSQKITYYWIRIDQTTSEPKPVADIIVAGSAEDTHHHHVIVALETELADTRVLLQSSMENMETINEEIQATNEELMSSNEELQSANEELQSVNEELYNLSAERAKSIEDVVEAKNDILNLISSAEISTIILNSQLEIRMFTPAMEKFFHLVSHDIGRPLKNFRHTLQLEHFMDLVAGVLQHNKPYESEVKNQQNHWYFLKMVPYYAYQSQEAVGVVITLTDIHYTKALQQQKIAIEKDLGLALKAGIIGVWHVDMSNDAFSYDDTIQYILGLDKSSSLQKLQQFLASVHQDDRKSVEQAFAQVSLNNTDFDQSFRIVQQNGNVRYLSCSATMHYDESKEQPYLTGVCFDMTERYWLEEKIIDAEHLNLGLDAITDGWWDLDLITQQVYLSPLLKKTLGYADYELPNLLETYEQLMLAEDRHLVRAKMDVYLANNSTQPMITTLRFRHKNGDIVWALSRRKGILNHQGKVVRVIGTITNITVLKEHENFLKQMAYNDFLTKACNKLAFIDATVHAIARAKRNQQQVAVIFVDLDNFKSINDTWGHHFGDEVLCRVTQILTSFLRVSDLLARMGGDEFAILLEDMTNSEELRAVAARVISAFTEPLLIEKIKVPVTISMGLALYPVHGKTERAILKHADHNMYLAKQQGKNQFVL